MRPPSRIIIASLMTVAIIAISFWPSRELAATPNKVLPGENVGYAKTDPPLTQANTSELMGNLPLAFIENRGQRDRQVKYYTQGYGPSLAFTRRGVEMILPPNRTGGGPTAQPTRLSLTPVGMRRGIKLAAVEPLPGKINYLIGKNPQEWVTDIRTYKAVLFKGAYPGIDLKFYGKGCELEYDIIVRPGADPSRVQLRYSGARSLEVSPEGDLTIHLPDGGRLVQRRPVVYQEIAGVRVPREGKFRLTGDAVRLTYGFDLAAYDPRYPLVIDPVVVYATYLGGSSTDWGFAVSTDTAGCVYVAGGTASSDFPKINSLTTPASSYQLAYVTKFNAQGTALVYSTVFGGGNDEAYGIAVDDTGCAVVVGSASPNFPTVNPQTTITWGGGFICKITPAGNGLVYSSIMPGTANAVALDGSGNAYMTGGYGVHDFPAYPPTNPLQWKRVEDALVAKFNSQGALVYVSYLGGSENDEGKGIAVDSLGCAYVTGETYSSDFPLKGAYQAQMKGSSDVFVSKLSPSGQSLEYSTYLGGTSYELARAIAVDRLGQAYVIGYSGSIDFPAKNAYYPISGFLTKFNPAGNDLVYSTGLGQVPFQTLFAGTQYTSAAEPMGLALDEAGNVYVAGLAEAGNYLAWLVKVNAAGSRQVYGLSFDGSANDKGWAVATDRRGTIYVTGYTLSTNFPTKNALFPNKAGAGFDAFLVKVRDTGTPGAITNLLLQ